ncbi:MAG: hypothetical protein PSV16_03480 [Flavobacterium sp.]|nr:hypothetical protein [Flavobacterium sp.]
MTVIQKYTIRLLLLLPIFAFANSAAAPSGSISQKSQSHFSVGNGHHLAFLQPESIHTVIANSKDIPNFMGRCADNFLIPMREIAVKSDFSAVCIPYNCKASNISRLLFPFHFFW